MDWTHCSQSLRYNVQNGMYGTVLYCIIVFVVKEITRQYVLLKIIEKYYNCFGKIISLDLFVVLPSDCLLNCMFCMMYGSCGSTLVCDELVS
jgi:hypothetical protein